jgi:hypothetical protein
MACQVLQFDAREVGSICVSLTYDDPSRTGKTTSHTDTYHGQALAKLAALVEAT